MLAGSLVIAEGVESEQEYYLSTEKLSVAGLIHFAGNRATPDMGIVLNGGCRGP